RRGRAVVFIQHLSRGGLPRRHEDARRRRSRNHAGEWFNHFVQRQRHQYYRHTGVPNVRFNYADERPNLGRRQRRARPPECHCDERQPRYSDRHRRSHHPMRSRISKLTVPIAAVLVLTLASSATATTVLRLDLPDLVNKADSIVQGRVEQVYVDWDAERNLAFTYSSINVDDPMKGARRQTVLIRQVGGRVGKISMHVAGMPTFSQGEEVILFLNDMHNGTFMVVGMNQGKYQITQDYAISNASGIDLYNPKTGRIEIPATVNRVPLETFKSQIRGLIK